jgi:hypothetical protein
MVNSAIYNPTPIGVVFGVLGASLSQRWSLGYFNADAFDCRNGWIGSLFQSLSVLAFLTWQLIIQVEGSIHELHFSKPWPESNHSLKSLDQISALVVAILVFALPRFKGWCRTIKNAAMPVW